MLNQKDVSYRQFVLVNTLADGYHLCVSQGNAVIKNHDDEVLTRLSKQKVLAIMVVGHCTLTSPLVDFCQKNSMALIVVNSRLRPLFFASHFSEANYLLRQRQHRITDDMALHYARHIVAGKIFSHISQLTAIRKKDDSIRRAIANLKDYYHASQTVQGLNELMGIEGNAAKLYFKTHFADIGWQGRKPRLKLDAINVVLDIGYTLLFNFVECVVRLFGFDVYVGLLHQLWFKRKSLICDFVEPFRCIVEKQVLKSFNLGQFKNDHFTQVKSQYYLDKKHNKAYYSVLMQAIVDHKESIFVYVRDFYRAFMKQDEAVELPVFYFNDTQLPKLTEEDKPLEEKQL